jgi:peptidoglycan/LPS O-acetylase OafA/YrhL
LSDVELKPGRRFHTLDGLRGVGALMVMAFHIGHSEALRYFGNHFYEGYLAVDLFYVLSGVVLADAYEARPPWRRSWFWPPGSTGYGTGP